MSVLMNQDNRFIGWVGDCAAQWALLSVTGEEAVSTPYRWVARFTTADGADASSWLGKEVACRIGDQNQQRFVHGVVTQLEQEHHQEGEDYYQAIIEPRLVLTRLRKNLRVFQRTTVPDLVVALLKEHDINEVKLSLSAEYAEQEYFIQYRESDFDFISRLLESAGISYFFTHSKDKHQLVLADHDKAWPVSQVAALPFHPVSGAQEHAGVTGWTMSRQLIASTAEDLNDFGHSSVAQLHHLDANGEKEIPRQTHASDMRQQHQELGHQRYQGQMNAFWLTAGENFELTGHPTASAKYGVRKLTLTASSNLESTSNFTCAVESWPLDQPLRPDCITQVPSISGMLNATVVGPDSEEIHTDEFGRIKIQFPWDQENNKDDSSSCWIRVAQPWAGGNFGALFLPRIGSEVLVSFIQGHPDYPVITGAVYSNENPMPVSLPDGKNHTGFVSRSTLDGEVTDGHRILFDDKKDEEKLIVGAQKDLLLTVKNDAQTTVGNEVNVTIGANRTSEITEGDDRLTLKKGNSELTLKKGDLTIKLDSGEYQTAVKGGGSELVVEKGCLIESKEKITFKVGSNEIVISTDGITLNGAKIALEAKGEATIKGSKLALEGKSEAAMKAQKINVKGGAEVAIDGAMIKLG